MMAARNILKVIYTAGKWQIVSNGKPVDSCTSRDKAENRAAEMARTHISSQVLVYRLNGSIQKSSFFLNDFKNGETGAG